jgi:hypothetical protein
VPLDLKEIKALIAIPESKFGYPRPKQFGPLRYMDDEGTCCSRGCRSPTPLQLKGIWRCSVHAMRLMNEMLTDPSELEQLSEFDIEQAIKDGRLSKNANS